ncbi:hypothetical protein [Oryza sativa Japonica Group]|uniref:Uncharacterized protein n=1 Tax=Oryza sativa subsp. japonica TaxID=39947 RepID=Q5ZAL1_ORYSJ|nr:hypothetical protein [Oryza sativa Japonica Group]
MDATQGHRVIGLEKLFPALRHDHTNVDLRPFTVQAPHMSYHRMTHRMKTLSSQCKHHLWGPQISSPTPNPQLVLLPRHPTAPALPSSAARSLAASAQVPAASAPVVSEHYGGGGGRRRCRRPRRRAPSPLRPTLPLPEGGDEEAERGGRRWRGRTTAAAAGEDSGGGGVLGLIFGKRRSGRAARDRRGQGRRLHPVRGYGARRTGWSGSGAHRAGWSAAEDLEGGLVRAAAADVLGRLVLAVVPEAEHFALSSSSFSGARLSGGGGGGSATIDVDAKQL